MTQQTKSQRISLVLSASALLIAVGGTGGPALAAAVFANNSDKVDGKHAVGYGATVDDRKGKLVATNGTTGLLPNNIIAKAPDADTLDGVDSSGFLLIDGMASNADKLDGMDSTDFLSATGKASDADKLDGIDSTAFATRAELSGAGAVNNAGNPVDWTKLKNVPGYLIDGDAGQGMFHGTQFNGSIAANGSQTFFTFNWSKDYTVVWQAVPTTSGGRVSTTVAVENAGATYTYWVTVKNELGTPVDYAARYTVIPRT